MKPTFTKIFPKGSVLVFSLIILSLMLVTSLTLLSSATLDRKASLSTGNSTRSFQVADSGIEQVLYQVYRQDHDTMADLADAISDADGCEDGIISSDAGWQVAFYEGDNGDTRITGCDDTDWRNRVTKIKSQGGAGSTTRAVEVAVAQASSDFETGMIVMWSGDVDDIPSGWALCDGDNGTPDLTDRFVVGAGGDYNSGASGGNRDTTLAVGNIPSHQHLTVRNFAGNSGNTTWSNTTNYISQSADLGTGSSYVLRAVNSVADAGLTSPTGSGTSFTNMPPYLALAYIMKVD